MADFEERGSRTPASHDADSTRTCADCGASFAFGAEEQRFFESRNLTPPKRCLTCRKARRAERTSGAPRRDDDRRGPPPAGPSRFSDRGSGDRGSGPGAPRAPSRFADRGGRDDRDDRGDRGDPRRAPPPRDAGSFRGSASYGGGERRPSSDDRLPPRAEPRSFGRPFERPTFDRARPARSSPTPMSAERRPPPPAAEPAPRRERPRYDITCQGCGVGAQVPFKPVEGRALFCKPCYESRKSSGGHVPPRASIEPAERLDSASAASVASDPGTSADVGAPISSPPPATREE